MRTIHTALAMLIVVAAAMFGASADARFLANDPVPFNPNDPAQFNRYVYANGDPINMFDPDGRDSALRNRAAIAGRVAPVGLKSEGSLATGSLKGDLALTAGIAMIAVPGPEDIVLGAAAAKWGANTLRGARAADAAGDAKSATNGVRLQKQMASDQQVGQLSEGGGTVIRQPAKQADRIAGQTGASPGDIQKVSSDSFTAKDGTKIETHSFRNANTNELIEPKTIIDP